MLRPLMFMRKKNLMGTFFGKHAGGATAVTAGHTR